MKTILTAIHSGRGTFFGPEVSVSSMLSFEASPGRAVGSSGIDPGSGSEAALLIKCNG